jgi:hypothetical protein
MYVNNVSMKLLIRETSMCCLLLHKKNIHRGSAVVGETVTGVTARRKRKQKRQNTMMIHGFT